MKKESWLDPVKLEDVISFALHYFNYKNFTQLEESQDSYYGKYFKVQGEPFEGFESTKNRTILFKNPINLGEFGILETLDFPMPYYDDFEFFFANDEAREICYAWAILVDEKNAGRKINGKTYLECFKDASNEYIELSEKSAIQCAKIEANMKKCDIDNFVNSNSPADEVKEPQKQ